MKQLFPASKQDIVYGKIVISL